MSPVRWALPVAGIVALLASCGHSPLVLNHSALAEAELQQVADCEQVGALSETIDAGKIITSLAREKMIARIDRRARALGGTHLVWVYRTDQTAAARVFRCLE